MKSLESIRKFIVKDNEENQDVESIIPTNYITKLGQYNTKLSANSIVIEAYDAAIRSNKLSPNMLNNLLTILLLSYDNIKINFASLRCLISNIYIDVLMTLIISSCKNDNIDINSLKLFTNIVLTKFIDDFRPSYDFPLARKICPIHCPIIAVVKLLNRKNKHPKYVSFLMKNSINKQSNDILNQELTNTYVNAATLNNIPIMNTLNEHLLNNFSNNDQFGGGIGDKNQLHKGKTEIENLSEQTIKDIVDKAMSLKTPDQNPDILKSPYKEILDAVQKSSTPFIYSWFGLIYPVPSDDYDGLLKTVKTDVMDRIKLDIQKRLSIGPVLPASASGGPVLAASAAPPQAGAEPYPVLKLSQLGILSFASVAPEKIIYQSQAADVYKGTYGGKNYAVKYLKGNLQKILTNLRTNSKRYIQMQQSEYLAPPIHLVSTDTGVVCGYTMRHLEGYVPVAPITGGCNIHDVQPVLRDIVQGMIDIKKTGFKPCPEHGGNVMFKSGQKTVIIDLDDMDKCNSNTEQDTINQLGTIFLNCSGAANYSKYFDSSNRVLSVYTTLDSLLGVPVLPQQGPQGPTSYPKSPEELDQMIQNFCKSRSIKQGVDELSSVIHTPFLNQWDPANRHQAANNALSMQNWQYIYTSGNANDCLIHSFLTCCSPTFRKISTNGDKDVVARHFRTIVFADIPNINKGLMQNSTPLNSDQIALIGNALDINVLLFRQKTALMDNSITLETDRVGKRFICIYIAGDVSGGHFSAISINNKFLLEKGEVAKIESAMQNRSYGSLTAKAFADPSVAAAGQAAYQQDASLLAQEKKTNQPSGSNQTFTSSSSAAQPSGSNPTFTSSSSAAQPSKSNPTLPSSGSPPSTSSLALSSSNPTLVSFGGPSSGSSLSVSSLPPSSGSSKVISKIGNKLRHLKMGTKDYNIRDLNESSLKMVVDELKSKSKDKYDDDIVIKFFNMNDFEAYTSGMFSTVTPIKSTDTINIKGSEPNIVQKINEELKPLVPIQTPSVSPSGYVQTPSVPPSGSVSKPPVPIQTPSVPPSGSVQTPSVPPSGSVQTPSGSTTGSVSKPSVPIQTPSGSVSNPVSVLSSKSSLPAQTISVKASEVVSNIAKSSTSNLEGSLLQEVQSMKIEDVSSIVTTIMSSKPKKAGLDVSEYDLGTKKALIEKSIGETSKEFVVTTLAKISEDVGKDIPNMYIKPIIDLQQKIVNPKTESEEEQINDFIIELGRICRTLKS